jgi:hypothetical protein
MRWNSVLGCPCSCGTACLITISTTFTMQAMPGLVDNGGIPRCPADGLCPFEIKTDVSEQLRLCAFVDAIATWVAANSV